MEKEYHEILDQFKCFKEVQLLYPGCQVDSDEFSGSFQGKFSQVFLHLIVSFVIQKLMENF